MAAQKHEIPAGVMRAPGDPLEPQRAQNERYRPRTMSMPSPNSGEK